jgi:hypothetical protein
LPDGKWAKGKKLVSLITNPFGNYLKTKNSSISISADGLKATNNSNATVWQSVSAEKGFTISVDIPGPVLSYFEVTNMSSPYTK